MTLCLHPSQWTGWLYCDAITLSSSTKPAPLRLKCSWTITSRSNCHWLWVDLSVKGFSIEWKVWNLWKVWWCYVIRGTRCRASSIGACTATMCNRHMPPHVLRGVDANVTVSHRLCNARNFPLYVSSSFMFKNVLLLFLNLAGQFACQYSFMFKNVQECLIEHVFKKDAALKRFELFMSENS